MDLSELFVLAEIVKFSSARRLIKCTFPKTVELSYHFIRAWVEIFCDIFRLSTELRKVCEGKVIFFVNRYWVCDVSCFPLSRWVNCTNFTELSELS